ncbi:hypothetical protein EO92_14735 [Methanosarcina sp. 2.H.A.1B.4]|nr:hypothetical protein EO92_14735 [Methanosarcina sp. 2.H.A.1B.4]
MPGAQQDHFPAVQLVRTVFLRVIFKGVSAGATAIGCSCRFARNPQDPIYLSFQFSDCKASDLCWPLLFL